MCLKFVPGIPLMYGFTVCCNEYTLGGGGDGCVTLGSGLSSTFVSSSIMLGDSGGIGGAVDIDGDSLRDDLWGEIGLVAARCKSSEVCRMASFKWVPG